MGASIKAVKWAWSKLVEPGIIKAVVGGISIAALGLLVFFASLKTVPSRTTKLECRMDVAEARLAAIDSTVKEQRHDQKISAITIQNTAERVNEIKADIAVMSAKQDRFNDMFQEFLIGQAKYAARRRATDNP
jgi:hypothetical protein